MADYKSMYYLIRSAASKAIDAPPETAKKILQSALCEAEYIYHRTRREDKPPHESHQRT